MFDSYSIHRYFSEIVSQKLIGGDPVLNCFRYYYCSQRARFSSMHRFSFFREVHPTHLRCSHKHTHTEEMHASTNEQPLLFFLMKDRRCQGTPYNSAVALIRGYSNLSAIFDVTARPGHFIDDPDMSYPRILLDTTIPCTFPHKVLS